MGPARPLTLPRALDQAVQHSGGGAIVEDLADPLGMPGERRDRLFAGHQQRQGAGVCDGVAVGRGDRVRVRVGPYEFLLTVTGLAERRGSAKDAAKLYVEDPEGLAARTKLSEQLRVAPPPTFEGKGRPTKRDRRELERLTDFDEPDAS